MLPYLRFKFQRQLRRWRRDVRLLRAWATNYLERHIWGRWRRLGRVRRFLLVWWGIMAVGLFGVISQSRGLGRYYLVPRPLPGGIYSEGVVGKVQLVNPILADSSAAADCARLVFSGLTRHGPGRRLEPDLATSWTVSPDGQTYTFKLRRGVYWHDGVPFDSFDVVFTLIAIQNPDSRSPLAASWQGVTAEALDDATVVFRLPNPLASFLDFTTVGIIPRHLLESINPSALRAAAFNQQPVGTGPFKFKAWLPGELQLVANPNYHAGQPQLDAFTVRWYETGGQLLEAYAKHQLTGLGRVEPKDLPSLDKFPNLRRSIFSLANQTDLFFKTSSPALADRAVRQALAQGIDRSGLIARALNSQASPLVEPILPGQLGYSLKFKPPGYNPREAERVLQGKGLKLTLVTRRGSEYEAVADDIRQQWQRLGVTVDVVAVDLAQLQQSYIKPRRYDVLLYGINIGADPDVYAYWHSSQADDPGLNLSQYKSSVADKALETARVVTDPEIRVGKYQAFLAAWAADVPAAVLYTPDYVYAVADNVQGIKVHELVEPADRFYGVERWTVRQKLVPRMR
jgi:peptide/nickel transport system substrate-binding protein